MFTVLTSGHWYSSSNIITICLSNIIICSIIQICFIELKWFTLKKHRTSVLKVQICNTYMVHSVPLLPPPSFFCINPDFDTLFGSYLIMVSYQTLKKSISPHPYVDQTSSDWLLENKIPGFQNQVWWLCTTTDDYTAPNVTMCICTCMFVSVWRLCMTTYNQLAVSSHFQCDHGQRWLWKLSLSGLITTMSSGKQFWL